MIAREWQVQAISSMKKGVAKRTAIGLKTFFICRLNEFFGMATVALVRVTAY